MLDNSKMAVNNSNGPLLENNNLVQSSPKGHTKPVSQRGCGERGCSPRLAGSLAYAGALITFIIGMNMQTLPSLPFPLIGNLLPKEAREKWPQSTVALLFVWGIHYLRRCAENLFLHRSTRTFSVLYSLGAVIYYTFFGLWIGWSINYNLFYSTPHLAVLVPALMICVIGEVGNCLSHVMLRRLRMRPNKEVLAMSDDPSHVMPTGILFKHVSCPNYLFEIITWFGFALAAFTLSAFLFFLASTVTVCILGVQRHKRYVKEFDGKDGRPRYDTPKAVIPFLL